MPIVSGSSTASPVGTAGGDLTGTYPSPQIAALAVQTGHVAGGAITPPKIAQGVQLAGPLFDSTLGASTLSIDSGANGVAQTFDGLVIVILGRTDEAAAVSSCLVRVNGDSGANYDKEQNQVLNVTVTGAQTLAATAWTISLAGSLAQAGAAGIAYIVVPSYRQTTFHKSASAQVHVPDSTAGNVFAALDGLRWRSTAAINQVSVSAQAGRLLLAGSRLSVYGY